MFRTILSLLRCSNLFTLKKTTHALPVPTKVPPSPLSKYIIINNFSNEILNKSNRCALTTFLINAINNIINEFIQGRKPICRCSIILNWFGIIYHKSGKYSNNIIAFCRFIHLYLILSFGFKINVLNFFGIIVYWY